MSHTGAHGCHQGGPARPTGLRLGKGGEGAEHGGAGVGEELNGYEGQAGARVLEGHVEAALGEGTEAALLDVQLQPGPLPGATRAHGPRRGRGEALVRGNRVHLGPALAVPVGEAVGAVGLLRLAVVEGEGLPAGAAGHAQAGARPHREVEADVRPLGPSPLHEVCLQPVVLPGAWGGPCHVACLEGPSQATLVVQNTDFIPLQGGWGTALAARGLGVQGAGAISLPLKIKMNGIQGRVTTPQSPVPLEGRSLIPSVATQGLLPGFHTLGSRVEKGRWAQSERGALTPPGG